jgi:hypothetical protein
MTRAEQALIDVETFRAALQQAQRGLALYERQQVEDINEAPETREARAAEIEAQVKGPIRAAAQAYTRLRRLATDLIAEGR